MRQLYFSAGQRRYEWRDVTMPRLPSNLAALVRPIAVARCDLDAAIARGRTPVLRDFAVGHEVVADVVEVGDAVKCIGIGDRVIVPFQISCGRCAHCLQGLTRACLSVPPRSTFGLPGTDTDWGGGFADVMAVPFADAMLVPAPAGLDPAVLAAASDNLPDGYRLVAPGLSKHPGGRVLVLGGRGAASCGLYAVASAIALEAGGVDYVDTDPDRLGVAERLGANAIDRRLEDAGIAIASYPVTVDATVSAAGLALALQSTAWEGVCTGVGGFMRPAREPFPFTPMYMNNITLRLEMVNARTELSALVPLVEGGVLAIEPVVTSRRPFDDIIDAMADNTPKLVFLP